MQANNYIIRKADFSDLPAIYEIEKNQEDAWTYKILEDDFVGNQFSLYLVLEDQDQVIGFLVLMDIAGEIHINNIAVKEAYRRQGLGERLLTYGMNSYNKEDLFGYTLEVREDNVQAIGLYEKLGFVKVGMRKNYYKNNKNAIIMWNFLKENQW